MTEFIGSGVGDIRTPGEEYVAGGTRKPGRTVAEQIVDEQMTALYDSPKWIEMVERHRGLRAGTPAAAHIPAFQQEVMLDLHVA